MSVFNFLAFLESHFSLTPKMPRTSLIPFAQQAAQLKQTFLSLIRFLGAQTINQLEQQVLVK